MRVRASTRAMMQRGFIAWVSFASPVFAVACAGGGDTAQPHPDPEPEPASPEALPSAPISRASRAVPSRTTSFPLLDDGDRESLGEGAAVAHECEDTCSSTRAECGVVCDESCGECATDETCENGKCVCQSSCDGTRCSDGCGRPCACPFGAACDASGFCVPVESCNEASCAPGGGTPEGPVPPLPAPAPPIPEL